MNKQINKKKPSRYTCTICLLQGSPGNFSREAKLCLASLCLRLLYLYSLSIIHQLRLCILAYKKWGKGLTKIPGEHVPIWPSPYRNATACLAVLTQYTSRLWTDRQTETAANSIYRGLQKRLCTDM